MHPRLPRCTDVWPYRKNKLEEHGISDTNDVHVDVTSIFDRKRKKRQKRINALSTRQVRFETVVDEVVGGVASRDQDSG